MSDLVVVGAIAAIAPTIASLALHRTLGRELRDAKANLIVANERIEKLLTLVKVPRKQRKA